MMKVTNKYGLPPALVDEGKRHEYPGVDFTVTELLQSPKIAWFNKNADVDVDAVELIWSLFGKAVHQRLATVGGGDVERTLGCTIGKTTVAGTPDLVTSLGIGRGSVISDYKVTSVWSVIYGEKPEWEQQLNLYAWLAETVLRVPIVRLEIVAILRDWHVSGMLKGKDYPQRQVEVIEIPLWSNEKREDFVRDRVALHIEYRKAIGQEELPDCKPQERWERPTTYAVMVGENKRATKVLDNEEDAHLWAEELMRTAKTPKDARVVTRPGASIRCRDYCHFRGICDQAKAMSDGELAVRVDELGI
jgi:hypothetical protein